MNGYESSLTEWKYQMKAYADCLDRNQKRVGGISLYVYNTIGGMEKNIPFNLSQFNLPELNFDSSAYLPIVAKKTSEVGIL